MLAQYSNFLIKKSNLSVPHYGIVKDNNDPSKLGRVKVWIEGMLELETTVLPWVSPLMSSFLGGSNNSGFFSVPEIDSQVVVTFPFDDIYFGFYIGYWLTPDTKVTTFDTNYPNVYGFKDSTGNIFKIDKTAGTVDFTHSSGTTIHIDSAGAVTVKSTSISLGDERASVRKLIDERFATLYNNHTHTDPQGGSVSKPVTQLDLPSYATDVTRAK